MATAGIAHLASQFLDVAIVQSGRRGLGTTKQHRFVGMAAAGHVVEHSVTFVSKVAVPSASRENLRERAVVIKIGHPLSIERIL